MDEHVALGMGPAEVEQVDLPVTAVERHGALEGHGGQRRLERPHLRQVGLGEPEIGAKALALLRGRRGGQLRL